MPHNSKPEAALRPPVVLVATPPAMLARVYLTSTKLANFNLPLRRAVEIPEMLLLILVLNSIVIVLIPVIQVDCLAVKMIRIIILVFIGLAKLLLLVHIIISRISILT